MGGGGGGGGGGEEGEDFRGVGAAAASNSTSSSATPIHSSNIGFQLLKKHGWKEGTGLGISEQGRLEPLQAYLKKNKRGLGADKVQNTPHCSENLGNPTSKVKTDKLPSKNKEKKSISKRMKKMQEFEKRLQEKEFEQAFFRAFWPDNV